MEEKCVLKVRNPRSVRKIEDFQGLTAPRLDSLDGKRIAILVQKPDGALYIDPLEEYLKKKYPTTVFERYTGKRSPADEIEFFRNFDAWIFGVRNTGGTGGEETTLYEKAGIPGAVIILDNYCLPQHQRWAMIGGVPTIRYAAISSERWFTAENNPENFVSFAEETADIVVHALTDPLTEEEMHPQFPEYDYSDLVFEGKDYTEANEKLQTYFADNKLGDGISVTPPTQEAVDKMLTGTTRKPDEVIEGTLPPASGIVTIEKIAINAVMAGAKPEYLPVIITAVEMLCDPRFYAWHHFSAFNSSSLLIAIGGPIAKELGINSGVGYLGPGTRSNNTIGRAVSLCALNLGWREYTEYDGGMFGQPADFCNLTFCENEELSPWEPFQVTEGFSAEDSTVMIEEIFHTSGVFWAAVDHMPSGVFTDGLRKDLDRLAEMAMGHEPSLKMVAEGKKSIHKFGTLQRNPKFLVGGPALMFLMYPGQARQLAAAGFSRQDVIDYIGSRYRMPFMDFDEDMKEGLRQLAETGKVSGLSVDDCKPGGTIPLVDTNKIGIMVTGPISGTTLGLTCLGSYNQDDAQYPGNKFVKKRSPYFLKKITGAALTEAGK